MTLLRTTTWLPLLLITMNRAASTSTRTKLNTSLRSKTLQHSLEERPQNPTELLSQSSEINKNVEKLSQWFHNKKSVLCITGAGMSTDSGIPDYRGHNGSFRQGHKPMVHDEFMSCENMRRRYWGRSMVGWDTFSKSKPNDGHIALNKLEEMNKIGVSYYNKHNVEQKKLSIITQNVDGLHQKSGSKNVIDLHGNMNCVICMECGSYHCRHEFHNMLNEKNTDFTQRIISSSLQNNKNNKRADGDVSIPEEYYKNLYVPSCPSCNVGFVKPDVVYFGDNVPSTRVEECYDALKNCDGLFCIGTSLAVYSSFRFVKAASEDLKIPIAILNIGTTRAEKKNYDILKIESPIGVTLSKLVNELKE